MQTDRTAEQRTARELIKKMNSPKKYTVYLEDPNKTVIQTNCIELLDSNGNKLPRFNKQARIVTNKI